MRDYTRFVAGVRARYPRARLLLLTSPTIDSTRNARLGDYLRQVIADRAAAGDSALATYAWKGRYVAGCNGHPGLEEHVRMADELEPVVRAAMGW